MTVYVWRSWYEKPCVQHLPDPDTEPQPDDDPIARCGVTVWPAEFHPADTPRLHAVPHPTQAHIDRLRPAADMPAMQQESERLVTRPAPRPRPTCVHCGEPIVQFGRMWMHSLSRHKVESRCIVASRYTGTTAEPKEAP